MVAPQGTRVPLSPCYLQVLGQVLLPPSAMLWVEGQQPQSEWSFCHLYEYGATTGPDKTDPHRDWLVLYLSSQRFARSATLPVWARDG